MIQKEFDYDIKSGRNLIVNLVSIYSVKESIYKLTLSRVTSSRRSVSWGAARKTASKKKKKSWERKRKNACGQT